MRRDGRGADPRGALSQHQGAARRLHGALRRRRADGDAGRAHTGPPRRDAGRGGRGPRARPAGGLLVHPQRPLRRRHAPSRYHHHHPGFRRGDADRLRGEPRAPRRRRRSLAGLDAGRQREPRGGGGGDRAAAGQRGAARGTRAADAPAAGAHGRPARADRREPRRGEPAGGARTALWRGAAAHGHRLRARLRRAPHARVPAGAVAARPTRRTCSRRGRATSR